MMEEQVDDILQLFIEENALLTTDFTLEEVFKCISHMEHNKAPRPNRFLAEFEKLGCC
jgi:hypothetical protein